MRLFSYKVTLGGEKVDIRKKNKKNLLIVIAVLIFILCTGFLPRDDSNISFALARSGYCWGSKVNDKALNRKNGISYGTGNGQLVCTTYVSWAVHNLYKVIGYPRGGVVTTHYNWLKNNAEHVCTISNPSAYKRYKNKVKPGDIVVYNTGNNFNGIWVHVAIVGGDSRTLHHAISSGVRYKFTLGGWLGTAADVRKQASSCKVYRLLAPETGKLTMTKAVSRDKSIVGKLNNYSLKGAVYKVYKRKSGSAIHTFKIDKKGNTHIWKVKAGTYYIRETKAPKHFKLDKTWYKVTVKPGKTGVFKAKDVPLFTKSGILLKKTSADKKKPLSDAVYEIKFYDNDDNNTKGKPVKVWKIKTDENGCGNLKNSKHLLTGNPFKNDKKEILLPFGTYSYREVKAPDGYQIDKKTYVSGQINDVKYNLKNVSDVKLTPKLKTEAQDKGTNSNILSFRKDAEITDRVNYYNLDVGKNYVIKGSIVDKATKKVINTNGKPVTAERSFTAEKESGEISLDYSFDAMRFRGKTLVIFEELFFEGKKVAEHRDELDAKQTLYSPAVKTNAAGNKTLMQITDLSRESIIVDKVKYSNLIPGKEYKIAGVLMDKNSRKPILDKNGKKITGGKLFRAERPDGEIEIEFQLDSEELAGKTTVVFEKLYYGNNVIAIHEDINDKNQTVRIPKLKTKAKTGSSVIGAKPEEEFISIVDTVKYSNLISGKRYTVSGTLIDKNTGKPLLNSNNEKIKSEKTFVANASNGEIDIEFKVEKSIARGKSIVVFEDCYYENVKIASHSDIKDKNQTVHFENKRVKEENHKPKITSQNNRVKTGDKSTIWKYVILLISAQLLLAFILLSKFLKKNMA